MTRWSRWSAAGVLLVAAAGSGAGGTGSDAWPQWGGSSRDFRVEVAKLATSWPEEGPPELWRRPLGDGNSGIAVVDDRLYTMYRRGGDEVVVALDRSSGETIWEHAAPQEVWDGFYPEYGHGPHTTPLVREGRVYAIGIGGRLRCLDLRSGDLLWQRELWEHFDTSAYEFGPAQLGYSASPLAIGDTLIVVGGGDGHAVIGLDLASGATRWASQSFPPGFATPTAIEVDGEIQVVVFAADRVAGIDPRDGVLLWEYPHPTSYMVNASTPVWGEDNLLFVSSAYDAGSRMLRIARREAGTRVEQAWESRGVQVHHQTAVRLGDVIHASSGDFGPAFLTGVEAGSGTELYRMRGFAKANLVGAGERLIVLDEDGVLALLEVGVGEPRILARAEVFDSRSWTVPSLVGRTLYARDRREIVAFDLGAV